MASPEATMTTSSHLYYPFRVLGRVTDGLPFVLSRRGDECFLAVSIDRAFQVKSYAGSMKVLSVGHRKLMQIQLHVKIL